MKIDCFVAEIGSTTTIVNAFQFTPNIKFLGKGVSNTTVDTDVRVGLNEAIDSIKKELNILDFQYKEMFASSSAAGGLKMTVSGLVYEMTVKAAKEAALNAGANIHFISAGHLEEDDLENIKDINPNIILISGGTDYGEKNTAYNNLKKVHSMDLNVPIIYAGNIANHSKIRKEFKEELLARKLRIVENVYPRVDYMNIHPLRNEIYRTFEEHIIHAKGMENIKEMVNQSIIPTPGSVMESTIILSELYGNVMTIDVGGATTDIHSVCEPSDEYRKYYEGDAKEKRTVEGDLGVFINHKSVLSQMNKQKLLETLNISEEGFLELLSNYRYIPYLSVEKAFVFQLAKTCVFKALDRHVGDIRKIYTSNGQKVIPEGKDLSQLNLIVLTGGPLIHLSNAEDIVTEYINKNPNKLLPKVNIRIVKDKDYLMSSIGVIAQKHKKISLELIKKYIF